jgi:FAD/FMN-containing dehydrogenase
MRLSTPAGFRGVFRADDDARAVYSEAAGIERVWPRAIAVPLDEADLTALATWASATSMPLIARGSGSSMPGGAIGDGVIVDLSRWRACRDIRLDARTICVGPGMLRAEVDRMARAVGLRFPVDPSSGTFCTIGGMAATNAAGPHSLRFGAMRQWVRGIRCVFADGSRAELKRDAPDPRGIPAIDRFLALTPRFVTWKPLFAGAHSKVLKDSSGYGLREFFESDCLLDLLIGSEGTLAFFAELELDLRPAAEATSSVLGAFASIEAAVEAARRARQAGAVACEMLDRTFLEFAAAGASGATRYLPPDVESALLAEVEADDPHLAADAARTVEQVFREAGAKVVRVALDASHEMDLWALRHAASPILSRLDPNLRSMQFVEDCAVPPDRMPVFIRGVREIMAKHETRVVIFGHAGDSHVHVNPLVDVNRAGWRERVDEILDEVTTLTASLDGTLAGEHGDGRVRAPLLDRVWPPEAIDAFRAVKAAFDPTGVLNPGAIVARPGDRPFVDLKHDPTLPPLPLRARDALERVDRHRDYAAFRLEMLDGTI